jgi:hypothetical protein
MLTAREKAKPETTGTFMRLQILSDLHLEYGDCQPWPTRADVVILAGDIRGGCAGVQWAKQQFPSKPVIYVLGNHEFYSHTIAGLLKAVAIETQTGNVHLLENQSVQIGDFTFLGCCLWTDFKLWPDAAAAMLAAGQSVPDFRFIKTETGRFRPEDAVKLHQSSLYWLKEQLRKCNRQKTVVVTHHAPSGMSLPPHHARSITDAAFASALDGLIVESGVPLWVHGHTHYSVDYQIGGTRIFSNQRGYPQHADPGFAPDAMIEI